MYLWEGNRNEAARGGCTTTGTTGSPFHIIRVATRAFTYISFVKWSLAGRSVATHLRILRWCGFCGLGPSATSPLIISLHHLYRLFVFSLTTIYLLQECVYAYQKRADMDKLARVMFLLLCHVTSIAKQFVFYTAADRIDEMIMEFDEPLYNGCAASHERLLRVMSVSASRFVRAYSACAVLTCTLWLVFPVMHHLRGHLVDFPFWTHLDYSSPRVFVVVLLYSYYVTTLVGIANTSMDAFLATVLHQCKTQLTILRMKFETLTERARGAASKTSGSTFHVVWKDLFLDCLTHYKKISNTLKTMQDVFGGAILVQFGIGGWILCMAAYQIVSLSVLSVEFASMTLFICCILTELFLYCYYGNEVTVESNRIVESIYSADWLSLSKEQRLSLVLSMERAKRPLKPVAGLIIPLSLETFLKIIKSSYTFYAVLRQTK